MFKYYNPLINDSNKIINKMLLIASEGNSTEIIQFLIEKGADVHYKNNSPFHITCRRGILSNLKLLVKYNDNQLPFDIELFKIVIRNCDVDFQQYLLTNYSTNLIISDDLFITIMKNCDLSIIKHIVSTYYQINTDNIINILKISLKNDDYDNSSESMSLFILSLNVKINDSDKVKLFNTACKRNCYRSAKFFFEEEKLKQYDDEHIKDYVCYHKDHILAKKIYVMGIKIDHSDLLYEIDENDIEGVRFCIEAGIDLDITKNDNEAIRKAFRNGDYDIVQYLYGIYMERGIFNIFIKFDSISL